MRVFSDFHDYYDINLAQGQDESIIYNRKTTEEKIIKKEDFDTNNSSLVSIHCSQKYFTQEPFAAIPQFIGFCGRIYPLVEIIYEYSKKEEVKEFCYNIEQVDSFVEKNLSDKDKEKYNTKEKKSWFTRKSQKITREKIVNFFKKSNFNETKLSKYFEKHPIFSISGFKRELINFEHKMTATITYNPSLKDVKFFRIIDPVQTFQEIYMWQSNKAIPIKEAPVIDDKTMRDIKGFDKFSFKKDKQN
ncbi:MAG: hypothetical protein EKK64_02055 [Neisseriaceae bacterium]|nr:MAG: hypothetical protein EKK64_02055 [Neisseriaceae bacterium]